MNKLNVKGEVLIDQTSGDVKVVSHDGRLSFPVQLIEKQSSFKRRVANLHELVKFVRDIGIRRRFRSHAKGRLIQEKINVHLRTVHEPA